MKKYIYIVISAFAAMSLAGCSDFLTEKPVMSLTDELAQETLQDMDNNVAGAYALLSSSTWYSSNFILSNEMKSPNGMKVLGTGDHGYFHDDYNIQYTPQSTSPLWGTAYGLIDAVNRSIAKLPDMGKPEEVDNMLAEAYFLRALAHFDLVRTYALPYRSTADHSHLGVPLILKQQSLEDKPERNTVKDVYDQIIRDLLKAEELIDPAYQRKGTDPYAYASLPVIQALLSRVYLYSEHWQESANYAAKVIKNGKYKLWTADNLKDAKCYREDVPKAGGEIIFEFFDSPSNDSRSNIFDMATKDGAYGDASCAEYTLALYEDADVRKGLFASKDGKTWSLKYAGKGLGKPDYNNVVVLRLSEMYLNIAEACLKPGVTAPEGLNGEDCLKAITDSRGASQQPYTLKSVFREREREFAWEAHSWFDYARTGETMIRESYVGPDNNKTLEKDDLRWAMPIPNREIIVNPNIKQNKY